MVSNIIGADTHSKRSRALGWQNRFGSDEEPLREGSPPRSPAGQGGGREAGSRAAEGPEARADDTAGGHGRGRRAYCKQHVRGSV